MCEGSACVGVCVCVCVMLDGMQCRVLFAQPAESLGGWYGSMFARAQSPPGSGALSIHGPQMCLRAVFLAGAVLLPIFARSSEISNLQGKPDYRFVTLQWQYPAQLAAHHGFQVNYCELQAWGTNRCRTKLVEATTGMPFLGDKEMREYSVVVSGLRMATNYSFEVQPRETRRTRFYMHTFPSWSHNPDAKRIVIPTKGFSARASLCLPDVSEVEVSTGPHFSGRIAVESAADSQPCLVDGDPSSDQDTYKLRIDHEQCGSKVNRTAVETFILVQENLPILTHSTRRFLVLCTFQPETLTVRAGLNLPSSSHGANSPESAAVLDEVMDNNVQASALQLPDERGRSYSDQVSEAQAVMLTVIVAVGLVAIGLTVWWFIPSKSKSRRESILSEANTYISNSTVLENYENSLRDSVLDFEIIQDVSEEDIEENALREGVCNEILQETCVSLRLDPLPTVNIEFTTQSEV